MDLEVEKAVRIEKQKEEGVSLAFESLLLFFFVATLAEKKPALSHFENGKVSLPLFLVSWKPIPPKIKARTSSAF